MADTIIKTFSYKLKHTAAFTKAAAIALESSRAVWNAALEERITRYRAGKPIGLYEQSRELTEARTLPEVGGHLRAIQEDALKRLDLSFKAFFRRIKNGEIPGFPRFKSVRRYNTFSQQSDPRRDCPLDGNKLTVPGAGTVHIHLHRPLEGTVKQLRITRKADGWHAALVCEIPKPEPLPMTGLEVGIDVGLTAFATLSNGETVANPRHLRGKERALKRSQQALARKKRGSANRGKQRRKVALLHLHVANARKDFHHKVSTDIVKRFDKIAVEALQVRNMVRNHSVAKSIMDAGWATFISYLAVKAANAGREFVKVHPAYTSQDCSSCGRRQKIPKGPHVYVCPCGLALDRDHNAAINIIGRSAPKFTPAESHPARRCRNRHSSLSA